MSQFIYHTYSQGSDGEFYSDEFITSAKLDFLLKKGITLPADDIYPVRVIREVRIQNPFNYPLPSVVLS